MDAKSRPRIALVHDWLTGMRGGEKCLEALCRRWPDARLYTLLHRPGSVSLPIEQLRPRTSFLQFLPRSDRYYRYLLPIMPAAVTALRLPPADLVVSLSHCVAKSVRPARGALHVCYCFTPMRYAWHMRSAYFGTFARPGVKDRLRNRLLEWLRNWDKRTAERVTHFVAISDTVRQRIEECYGRSSVVIYPPVDTDFYCPAPVDREDYYLVVSALAPYKRIDLAIDACRRLGRRLVIIGAGQYQSRLSRLAGPDVHFLGWQSDDAIRDHLRRCRALLFPGEEDFGIVPLEAQACGTPVVAFGRGGATETVVPAGGRVEPTGVWFNEQSADCLAAAIEQLEAWQQDFSPAAARRQALRFRKQRFEAELFAYLENVLRPMPAAQRQAA
jgi:glycosyltransferase involved in cell wall biosynthesis